MTVETTVKSGNTKKGADIPAGTVVLAGGKEIAIRKADEKELTEFLLGGMVKEESEQTTEDTIRQMVSRVMAGETATDIFGAAEVKSLRDDFLDQIFTILDVSWYKSDFEEGPPMFMVMNVADVNGAIHNVSTGATMPMAMVYTAQKRGVLSDVRVKAEKRERPTKKGFYPINLVLAD